MSVSSSARAATPAAPPPCGDSPFPPEVLDEALNRCGRTRAMTVLTPTKPWYRLQGGTLWVRAVFLFARAKIGAKSDIKTLSFIHFARWGLIRRIPDFGQPPEDLRQPLFMFESNYNGTFDEYIDAFAHILTRGMSLFWGSSYGFPKPRPVTPFKHYIHANEYIAEHYYSAYPTATATMITTALDLDSELNTFTKLARSFSPETFATEYRAFLTRVQDKL
jgi:hypothetical protein